MQPGGDPCQLGRRQVLAGVDLTVGRGEVVGICGENGSGKSTLMRVLAGLLPSDSGEVQRHVAQPMIS